MRVTPEMEMYAKDIKKPVPIIRHSHIYTQTELDELAQKSFENMVYHFHKELTRIQRGAPCFEVLTPTNIKALKGLGILTDRKVLPKPTPKALAEMQKYWKK